MDLSAVFIPCFSLGVAFSALIFLFAFFAGTAMHFVDRVV